MRACIGLIVFQGGEGLQGWCWLLGPHQSRLEMFSHHYRAWESPESFPRGLNVRCDPSSIVCGSERLSAPGGLWWRSTLTCLLVFKSRWTCRVGSPGFTFWSQDAGASSANFAYAFSIAGTVMIRQWQHT